jgi:hypothetical protein
MFIATLIPFLAAAALASPVANVKRNNGGAAQCRTYYADITASAMNLDLNAVLGGA